MHIYADMHICINIIFIIIAAHVSLVGKTFEYNNDYDDNDDCNDDYDYDNYDDENSSFSCHQSSRAECSSQHLHSYFPLHIHRPSLLMMISHKI